LLESKVIGERILSKLKEILEEKRNEAIPSLPQLPFVSEPEPIIYNDNETKSYSKRRDSYDKNPREIIVYREIYNNETIIYKDGNNTEVKEESKKISTDHSTLHQEFHGRSLH
jgi:hypothetical protein